MGMLGQAIAPGATPRCGDAVVDDAISNSLDASVVWEDFGRDHWWLEASFVTAAARSLPKAIRAAVPAGWSVRERVVLCAAALPAPEDASRHQKVAALHRAACYSISQEGRALGRAALEARLTALVPLVAVAQREEEMARVDAALRSSTPLGAAIPAAAARHLRKILDAQADAEQGRRLIDQIQSTSGRGDPASWFAAELTSVLAAGAGVDMHIPMGSAPFVEVTGVSRDRVAFTTSTPRTREQPTAYADFIREAARCALGRNATVVFDTVRHGGMAGQLSLLSAL